MYLWNICCPIDVTQYVKLLGLTWVFKVHYNYIIVTDMEGNIRIYCPTYYVMTVDAYAL